MSKKLKAAIIAALVALAAGFAVSNGLISQQTADEIKARTDQVLTEEEAAPPAPQPDSPATPSTEPAPQAPTPPAAAPPQGSQQGQ
ncbi:hypothetical protein EN962_16380 [Mesorhizobium sp. M7A.F.Ca.CA.001.09.2.1]|uniref:hypothetical protein n=2 Tax=Phyllobacteriaceae TaxID=69277 RepID=UPI0002E27F49|nr:MULTISPECIES: hypothetical protein [Mesorhizobium]RUU17899.1 hypothetical protein EOC84_23515 [Mesorhizobium sp. Primo-B]RUU40509.1 hypothetical protein EOC83_07215 [Mesorhizobium sp. Primo-A]RUX16253.1 hypothetical protein EN996_09880 [Mesorhizobium sp. M7A.F.Ca.CA.002.14.1.2]RUX55954.1 hypothetical protein EN989_24605 [Mesorhizobium sp. M7A.F.Ca.CA.002.12.1.1]RUY54630.1 hypothetical protein EN981_07865 [Mesorhizobium sp. M7A.F.Ca.CA.001.13.2.1]RUY68563.1 hypothetical protein EN980_13930 